MPEPTSTRPGRVVVRRGQHGLELRVDGTLASRLHEGVLTGCVWDALAAPLVLLPPERRRRVLVLGLGGGSAARLARALAPGARIVGVEIDPEVLAAARASFGLDELGVETVLDDARGFLARERDRYDLVIEDVFEGDARSVRKPAWMLDDGLRQARTLVAAGGVLASNTIHETGRVVRALRLPGRPLVTIGVRSYWNRVVVAGSPVTTGRELRRLVAAEPPFRGARLGLEFRTVPVARWAAEEKR